MFKIRPSEFMRDSRWTAETGHTLEFTTAGNLEFVDQFGIVLWQSGTAGQGADRLAMQSDGNLVIRDSSNQVLWASGNGGGAACTPTSCLATFKTNGNFVLSRNGATYFTTSAGSGASMVRADCN